MGDADCERSRMDAYDKVLALLGEEEGNQTIEIQPALHGNLTIVLPDVPDHITPEMVAEASKGRRLVRVEGEVIEVINAAPDGGKVE